MANGVVCATRSDWLMFVRTANHPKCDIVRAANLNMGPKSAGGSSQLSLGSEREIPENGLTSKGANHISQYGNESFRHGPLLYGNVILVVFVIVALNNKHNILAN